MASNFRKILNMTPRILLKLKQHMLDNTKNLINIVQFQKISIPTCWKVNGNSEGGSQKPKFSKESVGLKWSFWRGGGIQTKNHSARGVWIFSGNTRITG